MLSVELTTERGNIWVLQWKIRFWIAATVRLKLPKWARSIVLRANSPWIASDRATLCISFYSGGALWWRKTAKNLRWREGAPFCCTRANNTAICQTRRIHGPTPGWKRTATISTSSLLCAGFRGKTVVNSLPISTDISLWWENCRTLTTRVGRSKCAARRILCCFAVNLSRVTLWRAANIRIRRKNELCAIYSSISITTVWADN